MPAKLDKESQLQRVAEGLRTLFSDPAGTLGTQMSRVFTDPSMAALPLGMGFNLTKFGPIVNSLSGRSALPTTENIASWQGGINAGGSGSEGVRAIIASEDAAKAAMPEYWEVAKALGPESPQAQAILEEAGRLGNLSVPFREAGMDYAFARAGDFGRMIGNRGTLLRPSEHNVGGKVPSKEVMDRVMNAGLRDKLLGFGAGAVVPLPVYNQEVGGRHDLLSRLLGIDYPGYVITNPNTGNVSQNEQLRQLGFGR